MSSLERFGCWRTSLSVAAGVRNLEHIQNQQIELARLWGELRFRRHIIAVLKPNNCNTEFWFHGGTTSPKSLIQAMFIWWWWGHHLHSLGFCKDSSKDSGTQVWKSFSTLCGKNARRIWVTVCTFAIELPQNFVSVHCTLFVTGHLCLHFAMERRGFGGNRATRGCVWWCTTITGCAARLQQLDSFGWTHWHSTFRLLQKPASKSGLVSTPSWMAICTWQWY